MNKISLETLRNIISERILQEIHASLPPEKRTGIKVVPVEKNNDVLLVDVTTDQAIKFFNHLEDRYFGKVGIQVAMCGNEEYSLNIVFSKRHFII